MLYWFVDCLFIPRAFGRLDADWTLVSWLMRAQLTGEAIADIMSSTKNTWAILIALLVVVAVVLSACGPTPEPEVIDKIVTEVVEVEVEKEVLKTSRGVGDTLTICTGRPFRP